jgi:hypothetical protein
MLAFSSRGDVSQNTEHIAPHSSRMPFLPWRRRSGGGPDHHQRRGSGTGIMMWQPKPIFPFVGWLACEGGMNSACGEGSLLWREMIETRQNTMNERDMRAERATASGAGGHPRQGTNAPPI